MSSPNDDPVIKQFRDQISDNDLQDITHVAAVISQALAITATRIVAGGSVEVPTMQGAEKK